MKNLSLDVLTYASLAEYVPRPVHPIPEFMCVFDQGYGEQPTVIHVSDLDGLRNLISTTQPVSVRFAFGSGDDRGESRPPSARPGA